VVSIYESFMYQHATSFISLTRQMLFDVIASPSLFVNLWYG